MEKVKKININDIKPEHKCEHEKYEYYRKNFVSRQEGTSCSISIYEIPPLKAAYPYHYHEKNEECFYIISGSGTLRTPLGEEEVKKGDIMFFPANENAAHKLTNNSKEETLVYIDFGASFDVDIAVYPDSNKVGVWGKGVRKVYKLEEDVEYYKGE